MTLHKYQQVVRDFALKRIYIQDLPGAALFLDCGLGKTLTTLAILDTLKAIGECDRVLVIAPLRVIYSVWRQEVEKWGFDFKV